MTSNRKVEANRRNALKSTGPTTPEGKAAVRLNALKHGLLSRKILLPGEDGEALKELGERLRAELQPVGELESLLVEKIVATHWRMQRLERVEAGIFAFELDVELEGMPNTDIVTLGKSFIWDADRANAFSKLSRYQTAIERSLYKAIHELQRLQAARRAEGNVSPPAAVDVDVTSIIGEGL